jgi:hypothetical protein
MTDTNVKADTARRPWSILRIAKVVWQLTMLVVLVAGFAGVASGDRDASVGRFWLMMGPALISIAATIYEIWQNDDASSYALDFDLLMAPEYQAMTEVVVDLTWSGTEADEPLTTSRSRLSRFSRNAAR